MIGVEKIGEIRRAYFEQHRSIKEIVRTLSVSRATFDRELLEPKIFGPRPRRTDRYCRTADDAKHDRSNPSFISRPG